MKKYFLGILGALLLGIVGNFLYDAFFKAMFSHVGNFIVKLFSLTFDFYREGVYKDVGFGFSELHSISVEMMLNGFVIIAYFVSYLMFKITKFPSSEVKSTKTVFILNFLMNRKYLFFTTNLLTIFLFSFTLMGAVQDVYSNKLISKSIKSLNVVCSVSDESECKEIKKLFWQTSSRAEFILFFNKTKEIALKYSCKIFLDEPI